MPYTSVEFYCCLLCRSEVINCSPCPPYKILNELLTLKIEMVIANRTIGMVIELTFRVLLGHLVRTCQCVTRSLEIVIKLPLPMCDYGHTNST